jgi:hypothetical protein
MRARGRGAFGQLGDSFAGIGGTRFGAAIFRTAIFRAKFSEPFH